MIRRDDSAVAISALIQRPPPSKTASSKGTRNKFILGKALLLLLVIIIYLFFNHASACNVWTDKHNYNLGDVVKIYFSVDRECGGKLIVYKPDGQEAIFYSPDLAPPSGLISAGTHYIKTRASEPCGIRKVTFKAMANIPGIHYSGTPCEANCEFNVVGCGYPSPATCNQQDCQNRGGFAGVITRNGATYQVYNQCGCIDGECQCIPSYVPVSTCNQLDCQSQGSLVGQPYSYNGKMYQRYKVCDCVDGSCQCVEDVQEIPCTGVISGQVTDAENGASISGAYVSIQGDGVSWSGTTDNDGRLNINQRFCPDTNVAITCTAEGYSSSSQYVTTDNSGNAFISITLSPIPPPEPVCSGAISGYVYDDETKESIPGASLLICQGDNCWSPSPSDSSGYFSADQECYSSKDIEVTCSAEGYESVTQTATTDKQGNAEFKFYLKNKCFGIISGSVYDANTNSPIANTALLICQNGMCKSPPASDANGGFSTDSEFCPSTSMEITCSADGYETATQSETTDDKGNANFRFDLKPKSPKCAGSIEGHVYAEGTTEPISGASILICQNGSCWSPSPSDSSGYYNSGEQLCPSVSSEIACSADGYETETQTTTTDGQGNANLDFHLKLKPPGCSGKISGSVYDAMTGDPITGASQLICQNGKCWSPPVTDDKGSFTTGEESCPSTDTEITCSADGYETETRTDATDDGGNANFKFDLKSLPPKCVGIIEGHVYAAGTTEPKPISEANILICQNGSCWSPSPSDSSGHYSSGEQLCPEISAEITCSADGYESATKTLNTDSNGHGSADFNLEPELSLEAKISADKKEYSAGEEITINYETNIKDAGKTITVVSEGAETPAFSQTFGENDLSKELTGTRKFAIIQPGTYKIRLKVWTDKDSKEAECEFSVGEKDLVLKIWTDKAEYKSGEEITINYEINIQNAGRRINVTEEGTKTPLVSKTFEDNTFSNEASGNRKLTLDKPGTYEVKFEAWTSKQRKDAKCEFKVLENKPSKLISLEPDKQSPQKSGTQITWTAKAEDPDGDPIYYRFDLKRPGGQYEMTRDWSGDNTWSWSTSSNDVGIDSIKVSAKDGKHGEIDDFKEASFEIKTGENDKPDILWFISNLTQPQKAGTAVTFTAMAIDPDLDQLQYKFWLKGPSTGNSWKAETDWVAGPPMSLQKWTWQTSAKDGGINEIRIWVRDGKHANADGSDASDNLTYQIIAGNMPPNILLLNVTPSPPASLALIKFSKGVTMVARATYPEGSLVKYRFELKEPGGTFKVLSDWDILPFTGWLPDMAGNYQMKVKITDGKAEAEKVIDYSVTDSVPAVVLRLDPSEQAAAGTEIKCTAITTELEGSSIQYKFWLSGPSTGNQWVAKTDWITEAPIGGLFITRHLWDWTTDVKDLGKNQIRVWVRDGSHAGPDGYDASDTASIEIIKREEEQAPQDKRLEITSLWPMQSPPQDIQKSPQTTWMTSVSKPDNDKLEFQFEEKKLGSEFKVVREFSSMPFFTWIPTKAGSYEIRATVRNTKGQTDSKIEDYTITDSNPQALSLIIRNAGGHKMPANGGILDVHIADSNLANMKRNLPDVFETLENTQGLKAENDHITKEYSGGEEEVSLESKAKPTGPIDILVFHLPKMVYPGSKNIKFNSPEDLKECWGYKTFSPEDIQGGVVFARNMPWIEDINSDGIIKIKNDDDNTPEVVILEYDYCKEEDINYYGKYSHKELSEPIMISAGSETTANLPSYKYLHEKGESITNCHYVYIKLYTLNGLGLNDPNEGRLLVDQWDWIPNPIKLPEALNTLFAAEAGILSYNSYNLRCEIDSIANSKDYGEKIKRDALKSSMDTLKSLLSDKHLENKLIDTWLNAPGSDWRNLEAAIGLPQGVTEGALTTERIQLDDTDIDYIKKVYNNINNLGSEAKIDISSKDVATGLYKSNFMNILGDLQNLLLRESGLWEKGANIYDLEEIWSKENDDISSLRDIISKQRNSAYYDDPLWGRIDELFREIKYHQSYCKNDYFTKF